MVETVGALRARLAPARARGRRIGLVPTMGALHDGHLRLIREASATCDEVVVSIFVNPTQFDDPADLASYPAALEADAHVAAGAGASVVFAPAVAEMYPSGFATTVHVTGVSERWEGAARGAGHFDGVATVVAKLLGIVLPDAAWFGQKDAQQVAVVRRIVADLNLPVAVDVVPTVREPDGLAMSSRNTRLAPADRARAALLWRTLADARSAAAAGERDARILTVAATRTLAEAGIAVDYWAVVDPVTFEPLERVAPGALAIVAARVGPVRLIDNAPLEDGPPANAQNSADSPPSTSSV